MPKVTRFFEDVSIPSSGLEIQDIIWGFGKEKAPNTITGDHSGTIDQIVVNVTSGSPSEIDVEVRYKKGVSDRDKLVYLFVDGSMPLFVESCIKAPFSVKTRQIKEGDIHLFLRTDSACVANIRVDIDITTASG